MIHAVPNTTIAIAFLLLVPAYAGPAELDLKSMFREGIRPSPFMNVVYRYAGTLLEHGRDVYGPQKSGLFLEALDRKTLKPLAGRPLVAANPHHDENLLRLLYLLKGLSGEDRYPRAADEALTWFLEHTQNPRSGLLPWGERLCWNVETDQVVSLDAQPAHELSRPWLLWGRCFELAPENSKRFAVGLWKHHVVDHPSGAIVSRASLEGRSPESAGASARHAGFFIRCWAEAYAHTKDALFLEAIGVVLNRYEKVLGGRTKGAGEKAASLLSLAIDCDGAARQVPDPSRTRLTGFAGVLDGLFCSLPHDLTGNTGFAASVRGEPSFTPRWSLGGDTPTTAPVAMMCVSRYENTGKVGYRKLLVAAADTYLDSRPGKDSDVWPKTIGHVISLELAAFRATARERYFRRAYTMGEAALKQFFGEHALPRASLKTEHYENVTGADTLALALTELHTTTLHITAVRVPVNTTDR